MGNSSHELVENTRGAIRDRAPPPRTRRRSHVHMAESRERGARPVQAKLFDAASSFGWGPNRTRITSAVPTVTLSVRSTRWLLPPPFFFRRACCARRIALDPRTRRVRAGAPGRARLCEYWAPVHQSCALHRGFNIRRSNFGSSSERGKNLAGAESLCTLYS